MYDKKKIMDSQEAVKIFQQDKCPIHPQSAEVRFVGNQFKVANFCYDEFAKKLQADLRS